MPRDKESANPMRPGTACPRCGCLHSSVRDSRDATLKIVQMPTTRRRRLCEECGYKYTTYEVSVQMLDAYLAKEKIEHLEALANIIEESIGKLLSKHKQEITRENI